MSLRTAVPACAAVLAALVAACSHGTAGGAKEPSNGEASMPVTICGKVELAQRGEGRDVGSTLLTVRDARSGERFVFEIPASSRGAFESALGAAPDQALRGASICASGRPRGGKASTLELLSPADLTINARGA